MRFFSHPLILKSSEAVSDGLSGAEDVYLDLLFGHIKDGRNVLVALPLHVAQLHAGSLFLR